MEGPSLPRAASYVEGSPLPVDTLRRAPSTRSATASATA